jgi:twitching motility two-component system response regulator PilG
MFSRFGNGHLPVYKVCPVADDKSLWLKGNSKLICLLARWPGVDWQLPAKFYLKSSINSGLYMQNGAETQLHMDTTDTPDQADTAAAGGGVFTIMVIDDSKTIRRTAESLLRNEGFDVVTAVDGFEALSKIADYQPDLIFMDIMMPRLDGYQTCALIKHHRVFKHTPVIMLSSKDGLFDRARGRVVGSDHYITKPFTREELLAAIEQHGSRTAQASGV